MEVSFNQFEDEILFYTFQFLSPQDLAIASSVCKKFHQIANDHVLWARLYRRDFCAVPYLPGKECYEIEINLKKIHKVCTKIIHYENYFSKMTGWVGMFTKMYHYNEVNQRTRKLSLAYEILDKFGEGELSRAECIFHNMLNWFFTKSKEIEKSDSFSALKDFIVERSPRANLGCYQFNHETYAFVRLKKEEQIYVLSIPLLSENKGRPFCFPTIYRVTAMETSFERSQEDTIILYTEAGVPDSSLYRTIRSYFDPRQSLEKTNSENQLMGYQVDRQDM